MLCVYLLALALTFYYFFVRPLSFFKNKGIKQGRPAWVLGDFWKSILKLQSFPDWIEDIYKKWPNERYFGMYQFVLPTLFIRDPELIKQITVKYFDHFEDHRTFIPENVDPLWGKNLFALKGRRWREMRPILSPSFTSSKMRAMFVPISDCAKNFVDFFLNKNEDVIKVELKDIFSRYCNDVIATTAFGIEVDSLKEPNNNFYLMGKSVSNFNGFWKTMKFLGYALVPRLYDLFKIQLFDKEVRKFFNEVIETTIRTREEKGIVRSDMIHLLMEARKGRNKHEDSNQVDAGFSVVQEVQLDDNRGGPVEITNQDIAAHAMSFFFGGFDSVSSLMCYIGYELAIHPDVQDRLRREVFETLKEYKGIITYEALLKMKYMDMVISETLRKWPGFIAVDRECTKPFTIEPTQPGEKPVHINPGDTIWLPIYPIHRDPKYYPDPEKFHPERFNDENKGNIDPYAYRPFGIGPRNCIGSRFALLENKAVIFHILANFQILPTEETNIPLKLMKGAFNIASANGFPLAFKRLQK